MTSQKYYSQPTAIVYKTVPNYFPNATLRTIAIAKQLYDRKTAGETLESVRLELGISRYHGSKLYNWYKNFMSKEASK